MQAVFCLDAKSEELVVHHNALPSFQITPATFVFHDVSHHHAIPLLPAAQGAALVSDYEKSKDFYVNKLGFAVVRENFREERNDWKLDLRVGEGADAIELEIFAEPNPPKRVNRPEACGLRHLAFRVDDVEATVAELEQMGIGCEPIRLDSYTQKKMTFFFDPDGLPLELHE